MRTVAKVIDISSHQGEVDFRRVKAAGYGAVIIKAGQGLRQMGTFRGKYLPAALEAGLDWGAYWWSDAVSIAEAKQEAQTFLTALEGLRPTYPVYMDQEYNSPPARLGQDARARALRTEMIQAFLSTLEDAGYYAGLYASKDWLENWVYDARLTGYDKWVAQYAGQCTYKGQYGMWQHHGDVQGFVGRVEGVSTAVDLSDCYVDYPAVIKSGRFSGWIDGNGALETDYKAMYEELLEEIKALLAKYADYKGA